MTRFDSCGTYQVSVRTGGPGTRVLHRLGNDLVSERVDLLTHLPATPGKDPISPTFRGLRDHADRPRLGRGILSKWLLRNFVGSPHRIPRSCRKFGYSSLCLLNQNINSSLRVLPPPPLPPCVRTRLAPRRCG